MFPMYLCEDANLHSLTPLLQHGPTICMYVCMYAGARGGKANNNCCASRGGGGGSFNPRSVYAGCVVDNTTLGQVLLREFGVSL